MVVIYAVKDLGYRKVGGNTGESTQEGNHMVVLSVANVLHSSKVSRNT